MIYFNQVLHFITKPLVIFLSIVLIGFIYFVIDISNNLDMTKLYIKYLQESGIECNKYQTRSLHRQVIYYQCDNGETIEPWSLTDEQHLKMKQFK